MSADDLTDAERGTGNLCWLHEAAAMTGANVAARCSSRRGSARDDRPLERDDYITRGSDR